LCCKPGRDGLQLCGLVVNLLIDYIADVSATQASVQAVYTDGNKVACDVHTFPANGIKQEVRRLFCCWRINLKDAGYERCSVC